MKKPVNHFPDDFKLKVVQEYLDTDCSQRELMSKYSLRGGSIITQWMRKFGLNLPNQFPEHMSKKGKEKPPKDHDVYELAAKVERLEKELEYEKYRTMALNKLIDVAERDLKISIRKKPGAKQ